MEPIRELIAVDLEMTGLQVKTDRILEIGAGVWWTDSCGTRFRHL